MKKRFIALLHIIVIMLILLFPSTIVKVAASGIDTNKVDQLITKEMEKYNIPGLSLGIIKDRQIIYLKGYGLADNAGNRVAPQTPFILGSLSKSFTALAIMQLVEQGEIDLDRPAETYLPWLKLEQPEGERAVTVRHLLNQTSGIPTYEGRRMIDDDDITLQEFVQKNNSLKRTKPVGTTFQYSNLNYMILGEIVERVSGLSYRDYIRNYIFTPLEMYNSYIFKKDAKNKGLASGYQSIFGVRKITDPQVNRSLIPAGYLISSAEDMSHYLIAQLNDGQYKKHSLLSSTGIKQMHHSSSVFPYGMGWFTDYKYLSHSGDAENFHSDMIILPERGMGLVILMNTNDALTTTFYGNVYSLLSMNIMNIVSNGAIYSGSTPSPTVNNIEKHLLVVLTLLVIWIIWSLYKLNLYKKRKVNLRGSHHFIMLFLLYFTSYIVVPTGFILMLPQLLGAPWGTIVRYMPGIGHAMLCIPFILILIGLFNMFYMKQYLSSLYKN